VALSSAAYTAAYPALLYATFLAAFFAAADLDLDSYYYSEMSEAGYVSMGESGGDVFLVP